MSHNVIIRQEMLEASLNLGGSVIPLSDYATTGLMAIAVGPRGNGKTNAGLLIAEQLANQGWVSVLVDPEGELESMYGQAVGSPDQLYADLESRSKRFVVVGAKDASEFIPYGHAILKASDEFRKPVFVVIDEGQLFSTSARTKRENDLGEAARIVNDFAARGRKRAVDLFITAQRYTGTLNRTLFSNKNLTLIGCQEDPTVWAGMAAQFRSSQIEYSDLNALTTGEFFVFSRRGVEKVKMPMADALKKVALKAKPVRRALPTTFSQWSRAMSEIPDERLDALVDPVVELLGLVAGLNADQMRSGYAALRDEREVRQ